LKQEVLMGYKEKAFQQGQPSSGTRAWRSCAVIILEGFQDPAG